MQNPKFLPTKKVDIFKPKRTLKPRAIKELELERKLAKAGFKGFY